MRTLVLGASGATGKLVVLKLIERNITVKALIRNSAVLPQEFLNNSKVEIIKGNINDYTVNQVAELINDCDAIISCLGHNITFKGIFGKPQKLVYNTIRKIEESIKTCGKNYKLILMSTTAYTNRKDGEKNTLGEQIVFSLLKVLLPPHADNVAAGDFLVCQVNKSSTIEWIAVRPDGLVDETATSDLLTVDKKIRSPIFNPGKTSRINVAQFMSDLITNESLWNEWVYKTPVIYNKE